MFHRLSTLLIPLLLAVPLQQAVAADAAPAGDAAPAWLEAAVNDPARADDHKDDERRKMVRTMQFAGVKPGDTVIELAPGGGYWTRVLSRIVGPEGHVYTIWPEELDEFSAKSMAKWQKLAESDYANVEVLPQPAAELKAPAPADVVFTVQNYHDYHNFDIDIGAFNRKILGALKPGGVFVVVDHAAVAGSGTAATNTLHRIDPAQVKADLQAAGLVLDGEDDALANSEDPRDVEVFDESVRGRTHQFMLRFRRAQAQ